MSDSFKKGTWTNGDRVRHVETAVDAAQAQWDGFAAPNESQDATEQKPEGDAKVSNPEAPELPQEGSTPATGTGKSVTTTNPAGARP